MAKNRTIDLGPPTENLPEWSISADSSVDDMQINAKKPTAGTTGNSNPEFVLDGEITGQNEISNNAGLDAEFVLGEEITSPVRPANTEIGREDFLINAPGAEAGVPEKDDSFITPPQTNVGSNEQFLNSPTRQPSAQMSQAAEEQSAAKEEPVPPADPMKDWEETENALSQAAAMLKNISQGREENDLDSLRRGLDSITESLNRMTASAKEDMADVIEQTQRDNELWDAIRIDEPVRAEAPVNIEEPVQAVEPVKAVEPVRVAAPVQAVEPVRAETPVQAVEPVRAAEPVQAVEPVRVETPVQVVEPVRAAAPVQEEEFAKIDISSPVILQPEIPASKFEVEPEPVPKEVEMKSLAPLDESTTSGMDVDRIFEMFQTPGGKSSEPSNVEESVQYSMDADAASADAKLNKKSSRKKAKKTTDDEFESEIVLKDDLSGDGFQFVEDKGIVENPVEWTIDSSFQSGGQVTENAETKMEENTDENENAEVLTVSDVEDKLKKHEVDVKRIRSELGRHENNSGFAFALSDLK